MVEGKSKTIYVVMPAYNAEKTIERVFSRIPDAARRVISRYVVVNDGSTDGTQEAMRRLADSQPGFVHLEHPRNLGYGAAEKTLLLHTLKAGADIAVLLHSDGQYSPEKIPDLLFPLLNEQADLVQGSRMLGGGALRGGMPPYKYVANKILTAIENMGFGMRMAEFHSGYMVYSRKVLEEIPFHRLSDSFDFDLEMIVAAKIIGYRIQEIDIPTIYADETSYLNPIRYGLDVLRVVFNYRRGAYHKLLGQSF
ncbi:MAG: glycosyltransferase family 2 protein [Desulfobacterales bacterium]|nr:glycosyltransferase family 2 protein [Desulfobacterales bacterium]